MAVGATVDIGILVTMKNAILRPFQRLNKDVEKLGRTSQATARRLRAIQVVIASIIAGKAIQFGKQILEIATSFESVIRQLTIFTGSAEAARKELVELKASFADTAFSVLDVSKSLVRLKAAGVSDAAFAVKALADSVAAFGGGQDEIDRASIAIQQMAGKGVVSMEELRQQLGEAIPFALKALAKSTNRSIGQLINDIQLGKVAFEELDQNFFKTLDEAFGGAASIPSLKNSIAKFKKAFQDGISGIFENTTLGQQLGVILERVATKVKAFFDSFSQEDADRIADLFRKWVVIFENTTEALAPLFKFLGDVFVVVTDLLVIVSDWANKHKYGLIGALMGDKEALSFGEKVSDWIKSVKDGLVDLVDYVVSATPNGMVMKFFFGDKYEEAKQKTNEWLDNVIDKFGILTNLAAGVINPMQGIKNALGFFSENNVGAELGKIANGIHEMANEATGSKDSLGDIVVTAKKIQAQSIAAAEAIKGLGDDFENISPQAIKLNDNLIKLVNRINSTIEASEGFTFEGKLSRMTTQLAEFREQLDGMKTLDPGFAAIIRENIDAVAAGIDTLTKAEVANEFEKIDRRAKDLAISINKWIEPLTDNEKLTQKLQEIDLQYKKMGDTIRQQIADIEHLATLAPLTEDQIQLMIQLQQLLIQLEEKYGEVAKRTRDEFDKTRQLAIEFADSFEGAVTNRLAEAIQGLVDGTGSLRDVITGLYADITAAAAKYIAKLLIIKALEAVFGPGAGSFAEGLFPNADGNAFKGQIKPFANGGIVSGPTLFGLAGEAGTEAIMPLKRINGKLGVASEGGGGGDHFNITIQAIDTQTGMQFLQRNMDSIVQGMNRKNNLNRGIGRNTPR